MNAIIVLLCAALTAYAWHHYRIATPVLSVVTFCGLMLLMAIIGGVRHVERFGYDQLAASAQGALLGTLAYAVVPSWYRTGVSLGEKISRPES